MAQKKLAVIMDPITAIAPEKDGTLGMLLEAQSRSYELTYFQQENLRMIIGKSFGNPRKTP